MTVWLCLSGADVASGDPERCRWTSGPDHFERCGLYAITPELELVR